MVTNAVEEISREELKTMLEDGTAFKLVMTLGDWAYRAKHIPHSINVPSPQAGMVLLRPNEEIIVYCAGPECIASISAYHLLKRAGFKHVRRYAGGLADWEAAGYPLEGEFVPH